MDVSLGDIVKMRKPHPCGNDEFKIIRVGADIKIKCLKCARIIMLDRAEFDKRAKKLIQKFIGEDGAQ